MLKRVGLFGIRRHINQIVDFLNEEVEEEVVDVTPIFDNINGRLENALWLFGVVFRYIAEVKEQIAKMKKRLDALDRRNTNLAALQMIRRMSNKVDSKALQHALEKIEELEARIVSLENEGNDEQPDEN